LSGGLQNALTALGYSSNGGTSGACSNFYTSGFQLLSGKQNPLWRDDPKPPRGVAQVDPDYNTCRVRVTDHAADGISGFARNDYSRRQAFNIDNTLQLVYYLDGSWHIYNDHYQHVRSLTGVVADAEPIWHPTDPQLLYYLPTNGTGMKVYRLNVITLNNTLMGDLQVRVKARWPNATAMWTKSGNKLCNLNFHPN
jgi:hypothetical protein